MTARIKIKQIFREKFVQRLFESFEVLKFEKRIDLESFQKCVILLAIGLLLQTSF